MWMARGQQETRLQEPGAEWGEVTLSGDTVGVSLAGERRRVRVCLPGGYHWVPDRGETVLVVKSGPEEAPCVVGGQVEESIRPGGARRGDSADEGGDHPAPGKGGGGGVAVAPGTGGEGMTVTQLREGDYRPDGAGGFALATGGAGVLERVLFLLTARRGGFPLLPEVGSRLYLLSRARPSARGALGASYAAEALAGEENLRVLGAVWTEETRTLTVELEWQGEPMQAVLDAAALGWQDRQEDRQEAGSI